MFTHWHLIKRLLPYMRPYRKRVIALVLLTVLAAVVGIAYPWPLAILIDSILGADGEKHRFPGYVGFLDGWSTSAQIAFTAASGFVLVLVGQAIIVAMRAVDSRLEMGMVLDFRSDLFQHIQRLSFQYHDQGAGGRYIYQVNYVAHDAGSIPTALIPLAEAALTLGGMFTVTYLLSPRLALAAALVAPFVVFASRYYGRNIEHKVVEVRELEAESMSIVHEKLGIIRVVVSHCREAYEHHRFRSQALIAMDARVRLTILQTLFGLGVAALGAAGTALVIYLGATSVVNGGLQVGELTAVLFYVAAAYQPMEQITHSLATMQMQLIQMQLVFNVLDAEPEVVERPNARSLPDMRGHVQFDDVSFAYNERERTLEGISFEVKPGEFVAIVGPTGAGKSTIMGLIPRYFDAASGAVRIDGVDVRDLTLSSLRNSISIVMQEPTLFMGTIADNLRYGRLDATDEEIVAGAKAANAHDFVSALPEGYETKVGERGARISGGERQRLAIARAFVRDTPILLLDEPTSSIDSKTEAVVLEALDRLRQGRTTIMIAHRLWTIRNADRIVVVDDGRVIEQGTHAELVAAGGSYAEMVKLQDTGSDPDNAAVGAVNVPVLVEPESSATATEVPMSGTLARPVVPTPLAVPARSPWGQPAAAVASSIGLRRRPKVVVLGMMTKIPVAGVVWQTMHYLIGLERLGVEAYYVEAHARTPSMFMETEQDDGSRKAAEFIAATMHRFGLDHRWAFHALHDDGAVYGMSASELAALYASADIIINLHGGTSPLPEHAATGRLIYLETDPVQLQIELFDGDQAAIDFLEPHAAFFTFGENYGRPGCGLPVTDRFQFIPTRQPVVLDFWESYGDGPGRSLTTIGNWRQAWREVRLQGETYHWSKHLEFLRFVDLPERTGQRFELALSSYTPDDKAMLEGRGWSIMHALDFSIDLDAYRGYIGASRGEFTVAKDQNVRLRTGWFSDRSATYLAAGRPVITQDTGFGCALPVGAGLFPFTTLDDAIGAVEEINGDYERQRRAALDIARSCFDHDVVLRPLLATVGVPVRSARRAATATTPAPPFADDLDLSVVRRRPTLLRPETTSAVMAAPVPSDPITPRAGRPAVSIVVVTYDNLLFSRLCIESVLANTARDDVEVIVVDNASADLTTAYLDQLASRAPRVRMIANDTNRGFAPAVNQGLGVARGDLLVMLNNDTMVAPGWLERLERHLADDTIGMVGPLTNAAPNEARVEIPYATYGGFVRHAAERAAHADGRSFEIGVLTMFCAALRRSVYERVGPLDEQFEIGMFEDDDYALRLRGSGLRSVCAEDVIVHHFGEASFGKLVPTGEHSRIFTANRERFERKWQLAWETHRSRPSDAYLDAVDRVRKVVTAAVPIGATALVVSKGDDRLVDLDDRVGRHFPADPSGGYSGWYPSGIDEVVTLIDVQRRDGATHLVFPNSALWWFEFYDGLDVVLAAIADERDGEGVCRVFAFHGLAVPS